MRLEAHHLSEKLPDMRVVVLLDGAVVSHVTIADEEQGLLKRYVTDGAGNVVLNRERDDVLTETLHGSVQILLEKITRGEDDG